MTNASLHEHIVLIHSGSHWDETWVGWMIYSLRCKDSYYSALEVDLKSANHNVSIYGGVKVDGVKKKAMKLHI